MLLFSGQGLLAGCGGCCVAAGSPAILGGILRFGGVGSHGFDSNCPIPGLGHGST